MKVRCLGNRGSNLPLELLDPRSNRDANTQFSLTVGQTYLVYGITVHLGYLWYYLCDDDFTYFPVWNPSPLFEIVDHRVSKYWEINYSPDGRGESDSGIIVGYPEWARDPYYYEHLSDNRAEEVEIFRKYQRLIDNEYD
jgi:hypothetical protein